MRDHNTANVKEKERRMRRIWYLLNGRARTSMALAFLDDVEYFIFFEVPAFSSNSIFEIE